MAPETSKFLNISILIQVVLKTRRICLGSDFRLIVFPQLSNCLPQVFRLYLEVLELMGKSEKAIEELEDPKNVIIDERERRRLKIHFHTLLGNTEQCNILYKQALITE